MNKGYSYTIEEEKIKKFMKLTTKEKLEWLEEIFLFTNMVLNEREKEFRDKLRAGEI